MRFVFGEFLAGVHLFRRVRDSSDERNPRNPRRRRTALFAKLIKNAFEHAAIKLQKKRTDAFKRFTSAFVCTEIKYAQLKIIIVSEQREHAIIIAPAFSYIFFSASETAFRISGFFSLQFSGISIFFSLLSR